MLRKMALYFSVMLKCIVMKVNLEVEKERELRKSILTNGKEQNKSFYFIKISI